VKGEHTAEPWPKVHGWGRHEGAGAREMTLRRLPADFTRLQIYCAFDLTILTFNRSVQQALSAPS
jgi:hypothetical protein